MLAVADKEGGAHVDPLSDRVYQALSDENAFRWAARQPNGERIPFTGDATLASVRQIAYEVLESVSAQLGDMLEDQEP